MTRTTAREIAIQLGFSVAASGQEPEQTVEEFFESEHYASLGEESPLYQAAPGAQLDYIRQSVLGVSGKKEELDGVIARYSKGWRPERIDKAAAAILRQAIFEMVYMDDIPVSSSIDEAVELAKGYADADVVAFINGVLGGFYRAELAPASETAAQEEQHG